MVRNTTSRRNDLIEMFLDATPNEVYANGRLKTEETENGVRLVAYHEHVLAEVNRAADDITLYTGHYGAHSKAVSRYVHYLGKLLSQRDGYTVTVLEGHAPTTGYGRVADAGQFIDNYVGSWQNLSNVEQDAIDTVNRALSRYL